MDTTSIHDEVDDQLTEKVEAIEQADPADAVDPAERLAGDLEQRLEREADPAQTP